MSCAAAGTARTAPRRVAAIAAGALVLAAVLIAGCVTAPGGRPRPAPVSYQAAEWVQLPGWRSDAVQQAWPAYLGSCRLLRPRPAWSAVCAAAAALPAVTDAAIRNYFVRYFRPYRILGTRDGRREASGLVTAYFEPLLQGARTQSARFNTPLYSPPPDLLSVDLASLYPQLAGLRVRGRLQGNTVVPYYTRAQLPTDPALRGREIVWLDSALDAFELEVQGSGRVQLAEGGTIRLQYADQNGQPYRSIGRYLVQQGALTVEQASMAGIRAWLESHPQRLQEVLNSNPSVVFFKEAPLGDPALGPRGAEGVALTAGRSIAVDPLYVPLGTPVFLATTMPDSTQPLQRLVLAQDSGGAISGAPRADLFWGTGADAQGPAGRMRQSGSLWLLWPRGVPLPPH